MPGFRTEVPHSLGRDEATERLKHFLEQVRQRYEDQLSHLEGNWNAHTLTFQLTTFGFTIDGTLAVQDQLARLEGQLPLAALAFRGKIENSIRDELQKALS